MAQDKATLDFINKWKGYAETLQYKYGVPAALTLGQAILESARGTGHVARQYNNYFGFKTGKNDWFSFPNGPQDSFYYYARLLSGTVGSAYKGKTDNLSPSDLNGWYNALARGGYCNDSGYLQTLNSVIKKYGLEKYTQEATRISDGVHRPGYLRGSDDSVDKNTARDLTMSSVYEWQQSENAGLQQSAEQYYSSHNVPQEFKIPLAYINQNWSMPLKSLDLTVTDIYGRGPTSYRGHIHKGIDLEAKYIPCLATEDKGVVTAAGNRGSAGNAVTILYDRGDKKVEVTYMHLSKIEVSKGQQVHAGQEIAITGATGKVTGAHLHLQVKVDDNDGKGLHLVDPAMYITSLAVRMGYDPKLIYGKKDLSAKYQGDMGVVAGNGNAPTAAQQYLTPEGQARMEQALASGAFPNLSDYQNLLKQDGGDEDMAEGSDIISAVVGMIFKSLGKLASFVMTEEFMKKLQEAQKTAPQQNDGIAPSPNVSNTLAKDDKQSLDTATADLTQTAGATYQDETNTKTNEQEISRGQV